MSLTPETIAQLAELYEQTPSQPDWESRYKIDFCPGKHYDFGDGFHAVTGESPCLYLERKGQMCDGHENQNWSQLRGPETYRDEKTGVEYVKSRTAQQIAAAHNAMPALLGMLAEKDAALLAEQKDHQLTIDTFRQQERIWDQKFAEKGAQVEHWKAELRAQCILTVTEMDKSDELRAELQQKEAEIHEGAVRLDQTTAILTQTSAELQQANERIARLTEQNIRLIKERDYLIDQSELEQPK